METRIFHVEKVPDFFNSQSPQSGPSVPQSLQGVFKMQISGFTTCFFGDRPPQICNVNNRPVVSALYNRGYCFSSVRERGYRKGVGLEGLLLPCFWIFNSYLQHPLLCLWHLCSPESLLDFPLYLGLPFLCDLDSLMLACLQHPLGFYHCFLCFPICYGFTLSVLSASGSLLNLALVILVDVIHWPCLKSGFLVHQWQVLFW